MRIFSWIADKAAGLDISSTRMDGDTNDLATNGFGNCLTRDGQGQPTANLPMNNFRHTGVTNGAARTDYAALNQAQDGLISWTIAAGTADAITAAYTPSRGAPSDGALYSCRVTAANATSTPTFAPDGQTPQTIVRYGGGALQAGDIPGNLAEIQLRYSAPNTRWELMNPAQSNTSPTFNGTATFNTTGATVLATGTTAQRPGAPAQAMVRFNTTTAALEIYNGSVWLALGRAPTVQNFSSGSGTYTPATGVIRIKVRMVGGGGGGGGGNASNNGPGGTGGITSLGGWQASGAGGGSNNNVGNGGTGAAGGSGGANGTGTLVLRISGAPGSNGSITNANYNLGPFGSGGNSAWGGAGAGQAPAGNTGGGGQGGGAGSGGAAGGGGGGGEYVEFYVTNPGALSYSVGNGGLAGAAGSGNPGFAGAAGQIVIEEFYS